jgi:hypothetical protein
MIGLEQLILFPQRRHRLGNRIAKITKTQLNPLVNAPPNKSSSRNAHKLWLVTKVRNKNAWAHPGEAASFSGAPRVAKKWCDRCP